LGKILQGLAMEDVGIFYGHLVNFPAIWYILWSLGVFPPFWYIVLRKIWQTLLGKAVASVELSKN
jgi:hypothetical protein